MGVGLVRMDADRCPDVGIAFGGGDHVVPFALPRGNVEEAGHAPRPGSWRALRPGVRQGPS